MSNTEVERGPLLSPLIDIGVNLTSERFARDLDEVLARAVSARVLDLIITGVDVESSQRALELCHSASSSSATLKGAGLRLWCTAGVHPHDSGALKEGDLARLERLHRAEAPQLVAVGECGLDYERDYSPRSAQRACFEAQLSLAAELDRPLFLHERGAHEDMYAMLRAAGRERCAQAVVHCFTGDRATMERYLELGCSIGVTGWVCDERRGGALQEAAPHLPLERLLIETDAPYLTPRSLRPKPKRGRNEPATLPHIAEELARYMGCELSELRRASRRNAERLFRLPQRESAL